MRRFLACLACVFLFATPAFAQNQASRFSHGPTIPLYSVTFDSTGDAHAALLAAGAGYSFNLNFGSNLDGTVKYFTLGFPFFIGLPEQGSFRFAVGPTIGTFNNLVSFGAIVDLVNVNGTDSGAFLGEVKKQNLQFVFGINFNLGSGTPPAGQRVGAEFSKPPPNYMSF